MLAGAMSLHAQKMTKEETAKLAVQFQKLLGPKVKAKDADAIRLMNEAKKNNGNFKITVVEMKKLVDKWSGVKKPATKPTQPQKNESAPKKKQPDPKKEPIKEKVPAKKETPKLSEAEAVDKKFNDLLNARLKAGDSSAKAVKAEIKTAGGKLNFSKQRKLELIEKWTVAERMEGR